MSASVEKITRISNVLDKLVERCCVFILVVLICVVWLGILARYALPWNFTFTEELARYLMIWVALLSVSIGICRRQHVGMLVIFDLMPGSVRKMLSLAFDIIGMIFFAVIFYYSLNYVERGFSQSTMVFSMPRGYPYLIIPVASGMAFIQLFFAAVLDVLNKNLKPATSLAQ